jgi:hypothetical protein
VIPFLCMSAFVESETAQFHRSREKNPQTQQASRYVDPQGRISHKCIRDLEDFFGYTVLREDPSLLWSNISTCSARNPVRSSLCVPAVDLFFLFFFFFCSQYPCIRFIGLGWFPGPSDLPAMSYMPFQFSSRPFSSHCREV